MRINEYIPIKRKNAENDKNEEENKRTQTLGQKVALQSIKARAKQNKVLSKDALYQIKKDAVSSNNIN